MTGPIQMSRGFLLRKWLADRRNGVLICSALGGVLVSQGFRIVLPLLFRLRWDSTGQKRILGTCSGLCLGAGPPHSPVPVSLCGTEAILKMGRGDHLLTRPSVRDISALCSDRMLHFDRIAIDHRERRCKRRVAYSSTRASWS